MASLISEDPASISDNAANFSQVYSPISKLSTSTNQLPDYFLGEYPSFSTPNTHENSIRVNSKIYRSLKEAPRFAKLPTRFENDGSLSQA